MASPQLEKGYVRIAYELQDEILRRNFSKRQQNIILFILRLSYGTGQKDCLISKYNRFEIAGIDKSDVKNELKYLRTCKVLNWDEDSMIFSVNKNYDVWQVNPNKKWDEDKFKELIHENLNRRKVGKTPTNEPIQEVGKTPTKKRQYVGKIPTSMLVKHQLGQASIPCESKAEPLPKDIIIDNIIDNKTKKELFIVLGDDYQNIRLRQSEYDKLVQEFGDDLVMKKEKALERWLAKNSHLPVAKADNQYNIFKKFLSEDSDSKKKPEPKRTYANAADLLTPEDLKEDNEGVDEENAQWL
jgi:hypothetical protein